jgi:hypothetical protein
MIAESDKLYNKLLIFIAEEAGSSAISLVRAFSKATNMALRILPEDKQPTALKLAKSEVEYKVKDEGGLAEVLLKESGHL